MTGERISDMNQETSMNAKTFCTECGTPLQDRQGFCHMCGKAVKWYGDDTNQRNEIRNEMQKYIQIQENVSAQPESSSSRRTLIIVASISVVAGLLFFFAACIFAAALTFNDLGGFGGRSNLSSAILDGSGNSFSMPEPIDHPREDEILAHLYQKYGEEFVIDFYTKDDWGGPSTVLIARANDFMSMFSVIYAEDGQDLPVEKMRDGYQLILASELVEDCLRQVVNQYIEQRDLTHIDIRFDYFYSFDGETNTSFSLPVMPLNFDWRPEDGLDAFFADAPDEISLNIGLNFRRADAFDSFDEDLARQLAEELSKSDLVEGFVIVSASSPNWDRSVQVSWNVQDGEVSNFVFDPMRF